MTGSDRTDGTGVEKMVREDREMPRVGENTAVEDDWIVKDEEKLTDSVSEVTVSVGSGTAVTGVENIVKEETWKLNDGENTVVGVDWIMTDEGKLTELDSTVLVADETIIDDGSTLDENLLENVNIALVVGDSDEDSNEVAGVIDEETNTLLVEASEEDSREIDEETNTDVETGASPTINDVETTSTDSVEIRDGTADEVVSTVVTTAEVKDVTDGLVCTTDGVVDITREVDINTDVKGVLDTKVSNTNDVDVSNSDTVTVVFSSGVDVTTGLLVTTEGTTLSGRVVVGLGFEVGLPRVVVGVNTITLVLATVTDGGPTVVVGVGKGVGKGVPLGLIVNVGIPVLVTGTREVRDGVTKLTETVV